MLTFVIGLILLIIGSIIGAFGEELSGFGIFLVFSSFAVIIIGELNLQSKEEEKKKEQQERARQERERQERIRKQKQAEQSKKQNPQEKIRLEITKQMNFDNNNNTYTKLFESKRQSRIMSDNEFYYNILGNAAYMYAKFDRTLDFIEDYAYEYKNSGKHPQVTDTMIHNYYNSSSKLQRVSYYIRTDDYDALLGELSMALILAPDRSLKEVKKIYARYMFCNGILLNLLDNIHKDETMLKELANSDALLKQLTVMPINQVYCDDYMKIRFK